MNEGLMKKKSILKKEMIFPRYIRYESKHYNYNYLALNKKQYMEIGLLILQGFKDNYMLTKDESIKKKNLEQYTLDFLTTQCPEYSLETLKELSNSKYSKLQIPLKNYASSISAQDLINKLSKEFKEINEWNLLVDRSLQALKEKNGKIAWSLIDSFRDGEYCKVKIEFFDNYRE